MNKIILQLITRCNFYKNKKSGFADILILIGLAFVAVVTPFIVGTLKQNQDIRQQAYEACIYGTRCQDTSQCNNGEYCDEGCCKEGSGQLTPGVPTSTPIPLTGNNCGWGNYGTYSCKTQSECVQCQNDTVGKPITVVVDNTNCAGLSCGRAPSATPTIATASTPTPVPACNSGGCMPDGGSCCDASYLSSVCYSGFMCGATPPSATPTPSIPKCTSSGYCRGAGESCCSGGYTDYSCGATDQRCGAAPFFTPTPSPTQPICTSSGNCYNQVVSCCGDYYSDDFCASGLRCGTAPTPTPINCLSSGCLSDGERCCGGSIYSLLCPGQGIMCNGSTTSTITPTPTLMPTATLVPTKTPSPTPINSNIPPAYSTSSTRYAMQSALARGMQPFLVYPNSGDALIEQLYLVLFNNKACGQTGCLMMTNEDTPLTAVLPGYPNIVVISAPLISNPAYGGNPAVIDAVMDHEKVHTLQTANVSPDFANVVHCPQDKCHLFQSLIEGQAESVSQVGGNGYQKFRTVWAKTKEWAQNTGNTELFVAVAMGHDTKIDELINKMEASGQPISELLKQSGW